MSDPWIEDNWKLIWISRSGRSLQGRKWEDGILRDVVSFRFRKVDRGAGPGRY